MAAPRSVAVRYVRWSISYRATPSSPTRGSTERCATSPTSSSGSARSTASRWSSRALRPHRPRRSRRTASRPRPRRSGAASRGPRPRRRTCRTGGVEGTGSRREEGRRRGGPRARRWPTRKVTVARRCGQGCREGTSGRASDEHATANDDTRRRLPIMSRFTDLVGCSIAAAAGGNERHGDTATRRGCRQRRRLGHDRNRPTEHRGDRALPRRDLATLTSAPIGVTCIAHFVQPEVVELVASRLPIIEFFYEWPDADTRARGRDLRVAGRLGRRGQGRCRRRVPVRDRPGHGGRRSRARPRTAGRVVAGGSSSGRRPDRRCGRHRQRRCRARRDGIGRRRGAGRHPVRRRHASRTRTPTTSTRWLPREHGRLGADRGVRSRLAQRATSRSAIVDRRGHGGA